MKALLFTVLALTLATDARAADVVELKNGDRITGTIVKMSDDKLVLTTAYAKEIVIDWAEVAGLQSDTPHIVRLKPDDFVTARFTRKADGVYLESDDLRSPKPIALDQIATVDIAPGAHWSGTVAGALAGAKGNTTNLAAGGAAELIRDSDQDRFRVSGSFTYAEQRDEDTNQKELTAQYARAGTYYDYFLDQHWSVGGYASLEHDHLQDLSLRTVIGGGPGYYFFRTKTHLLRTYLGLAYVNENYRAPTEDQSYVSLALGDEFRWAFSDTLSVYQLLDVYPNLEDTSDVVWHAAVGLRQKIALGLFIDIGLQDDYDTKPAEGKQPNDFRYALQLGYGF